jgi:hypothetical protein
MCIINRDDTIKWNERDYVAQILKTRAKSHDAPTLKRIKQPHSLYYVYRNVSVVCNICCNLCKYVKCIRVIAVGLSKCCHLVRQVQSDF